MKKNILTTLLLSGLFLSASAQVGINTTDPKATLDVGVTPGEIKADAVLVPRVTVEELDEKKLVYNEKQHGTLVFVTGGVSSDSKTANVSGEGFYFYDASIELWISPASGYGNGSFTIIPEPVIVNMDGVSLDGYGDDVNLFELIAVYGETRGKSIKFPTASKFKNRTISILNFTGGGLTYDDLPNELKDLVGIGIGAQQFYSDGTRWYYMAGRY